MAKYRMRTDLAMENQEKYEKDCVEISGVEVQKRQDPEKEIFVTTVKITSEYGAKMMEKPKGTYVTLEIPALSMAEEVMKKEAAEEMGRCLRRMLPEKMKHVLVVGLGNRNITPDALGPMVADRLEITRHLIREYGSTWRRNQDLPMVSAAVPGVMAQTGMEPLEMVRGIVKEIQPDIVLAVDALSACSMKRMNSTIQLADTGIWPGSGVGNHRRGLNLESVGVPVIGIGVPTVVGVGTILHDAVSHLLESLEESEMEEFLEELIPPELQTMYVTTKDIDEIVRNLADTVANGLHAAFFGNR